MHPVALLALLGPADLARATPTDTAAETGAPGDTGTPGSTPIDTGGDTGTAEAPADTGTGADLDADADADGFTPREGDCDDANRDAHPGQPEVCNDRVDNDCDGLYDEGCDESVRLASLRGGGGCTGGSGLAGTRASSGPAALLLLLLPIWSFWWRRRR